MAEKFAVIGAGHFGTAIAVTLSKKGAEVMVIDTNQDKIDAINDEVSYAVCLDATDKKALMSQDIKDFDAVVVAIGQNFEARLLCAAVLLDIGVKKIICRSLGMSQRLILDKMGVTEILSPEDEVALIVAERLMNPSVISYLQLPDDHRIAEVLAPRKIAGRTYGDLNLRDRYKLSMITIKRDFLEIIDKQECTIQHIIGVPDTKTIIQPNDSLVIFGKNRDIERFIEINS
ncbi:MAG: TrkA family potassium uptake protein [Bacteroidales bacterium]|nr:TrkA family potassium uptake protein [Bacteroidales bacterium]MDD4574834.1 TrkA family potassium uptake protein [Bacteroidales bacterium]